MIKSFALLAILVLAGCTTTSGIIPMGKDTYMVSGTGKSPGGYSGGEVKVAALKEATQFCSGMKKQVQIVRTDQRDMSFGVNATAELQFMCLDSTDSEFARPRLKKDADQVIEVKKEIKTTVTPTQTPTPASKDVYAELLKLDDLRKRGIITEVEFDSLKKALLAGK